MTTANLRRDIENSPKRGDQRMGRKDIIQEWEKEENTNIHTRERKPKGEQK